MKDAKGHGSNKRGAHAMGVDQVGKPQAWFHGTPHAAKVQKQGFNLDNLSKNSGSRGIHGTGVYISEDAGHAKLYGKVMNVEVSPGLKLFEPKDMISDIFGEHTNYGDPDSITRYYRERGYDGITFRGKDGHRTAVVFDPANVKVRK